MTETLLSEKNKTGRSRKREIRSYSLGFCSLGPRIHALLPPLVLMLLSESIRYLGSWGCQTEEMFSK